MPTQNLGPLLTFALFAYNQEQFIAEAVLGALSQTYSPLEIILSDDCSSDSTFEIMQEMAKAYQGPNQVIVRRNEKNLGLIGHINRVMEMVKGELIVVAAGDDVSLPQRSERIFKKYVESNFEATCIFSKRWKEIDDKGNILGEREFQPRKKSSLDLEYFGTTRHFVPGHSNSWHRSVFDFFGPIDNDVISEDVVIPLRAAILGQVLFIDEPLIFRRLHSANLGAPRIALTIKEKADWYRKNHLSLVRNRIGIAKSFLKDLEQARNMLPERKKEFDQFSEYYKKYLESNFLAFEYVNANFLNRLRIIRQTIAIKMRFTQFVQLFFGHYLSVILQLFLVNWFYEKYMENRSKKTVHKIKLGEGESLKTDYEK